MAALLAIGALVGVSSQSLVDGGLLRQMKDVRAVQDSHLADFLPHYTVGQVREAIAAGAHVIDARFGADFDSGHLPGAVDVPVSTAGAVRRRLLSDVPRGALVVVYCQSNSCPFSGDLARELLRDGFTNVALFPGGWEQWCHGG